MATQKNKIYTPKHWRDYELIDSGDYEKLERFGDVVLVRPEQQAFWKKTQSVQQWEKMCHARFQEGRGQSGEWIKLAAHMPDHWPLSYSNGRVEFALRLRLTRFKHVGVFPEQATNWDYISESLAQFETPVPKVLNLFAYTGGASLAARAAGANVTHVDSIKQVVSWANENQQLSRLQDIRWVVEDALKFVKREVKRGNTYHGIILDPPAYGLGPNGERWKLQEKIVDLLTDVTQLLDPAEHFLILNVYSLGISPGEVEQLIRQVAPSASQLQCGELGLPATHGNTVHLGAFGRFRKLKV